MSITKLKNGKWQASVGRGAERVRRNFATRAEAKRAEGKMLKTHEKPPSRGLEEALLLHLKRAKTESRNPERLISHCNMLRPYIQGRVIEQAADAAKEMIEDWHDLAPATINRRLAILKRLCNLALEQGWTDEPVARRIRLLRNDNAREIFLDYGQIIRLAECMPRSGDGVILSAFTGLTVSEIFSVGPENIKTGGHITIRRSKTMVAATIPVPAWMHCILGRLPFRFTEGVRKAEWKEARKQCNLEHVHWHDLRHTYASFLVAAGANDREIQYLMRLKSITMVQRYAHLRESQPGSVVARI